MPLLPPPTLADAKAAFPEIAETLESKQTAALSWSNVFPIRLNHPRDLYAAMLLMAHFAVVAEQNDNSVSDRVTSSVTVGEITETYGQYSGSNNRGQEFLMTTSYGQKFLMARAGCRGAFAV